MLRCIVARRMWRRLLPVERFTPDDRRATFVLWLVGLFQGFAQAHASSTLPFTRVALGLTQGEMSEVLAITRLATIGALLFSAAGDRRGRKTPLLAAYTLLMASTVATATVSSPWQFTAAQSLVRVGTAGVSSLVVVLLAEQLTPSIRAYGIALYGASGSLGAGLALLALPLADNGPSGWRYPFLLGAVGLVALPFLRKAVRESRLFEPDPRPLRIGELVAGEHSRSFWLLGGTGFLAAAYSAVGIAFSTERLVNELGLSTSLAVAISLIGGTVGGVGFFLGGRLADQWGRRPTTILALLAGLIGGMGLYWLNEPALLVPAGVVSAFGSFAFVPAAGAHRSELFPTRLRATAVVAINNLAMLGSAAGLFFGRLTIDAIGLSQTMTILGFGSLVGALLVLRLPETKGIHLERPTPTG